MFNYLPFLSGLRKSLAGLRSNGRHRFVVGALCFSVAVLAGCGNGFRLLAPGADGASLSGFVRGGNQPVVGAHLELFAAGSGEGTVSSPVLSQPVVTNSEGWFSVAGLYACPSASSQMYLVATGGSTDRSTNASNQASVMIAALGRCDAMSSLPSVDIDEVTTVASVSELAPSMQSTSSVAAEAANAELLSDAFTAARQLATLVKQTPADSSLAKDQDSPLGKVAALANILSTCNGTASDKTSCRTLLAAASQGAGSGDIATAMLQIAKNPTRNVNSLFSVHPAVAPFQSALASAPANWTVSNQTKVPAPTFSPLPGTFNGPVTLTLKDSMPGARIYYNTGAAWLPYTGPVTLPASTTVTAIALINGMSLLGTGNYTITPQTPVSVSQPANVAAAATVSSAQLPVAAAKAATTLTGSPSLPPTISYASGFTPAGLSLNGATIVGNALQLTDNNIYEGHSAFFSTPVNVQAFTTDFIFQQNTPIADGFTFTLQNDPAGTKAIGYNGGDLGYYGVKSSVAIKFDLYSNQGEGTNSTGFYSNGATPTWPTIDLTPSGINLHNGNIMHANIVYDGTTLTLKLTDTVTNKVFTTATAINIPATVGGNMAYAGFTAGTGGLTATQNILSWTYTVNPSASTISYASGFTPAGLSLNGATIVGNALQLTDNNIYEGHSAFFSTPVNVQAFTTDFIFQQNTPIADGFTFTLQNDPAGTKAIGYNGGDLGYYGVKSSVAIKFDLYSNQGEGTNSTGFYSNGATPTWPTIDLTPSGINLHNGNIMHANIVYDGTTLTLKLTDTVTNKVFTTATAINIPATVGGNMAYAGFTAGTGGLTATQNILSWTYTVTGTLSLTPSSVNLTPSQTQQFTASAANTTNAAVTWTLNPAVGSITSTGLYTAPATLPAAQTVVVTATSIADPTKTASASIAITPPVSVGLTPGNVTLMSSNTQQFTAAVVGSTNTAVTWTLSPAIGSISPAGVYAAPASIPTAQIVMVTATSAADTTKTASAGITLAPSTPAKLQFLGQPSDISTRGVIAPTVIVAVKDNNGNVVANSSNAVTLSLTGATGLTGTLTAVPVNGIATFSGLAVPTVGNYTLTATSPALASTVSASFNVTLLDPGFSGPIVITQGGTYTGNWESLDPNVVAVRVVTNQPVIIQNSQIRGMCHLIVGTQMGLNLQISNVVGTALNPNIVDRADGIFLYSENAARIQVDHSTMIGVSSGFFIAGANATSLTFNNNVAINMDDRGSDGKGGKELYRPSLGHFAILVESAAPSGAEIAWNQVINTLGQSSVEDIISVYSSRGSVNAPIYIHDNYLQGAASTLGNAYSGGGMIIDGDQSSPDVESAYVLISNNQVVITQNNGISVPTGHDITVSNNRVVSSGKDNNGNWMVPADNLGCGYCQVSNYAAYYYNNLFINNYGGLARQFWDGSGQRVDTVLTASSTVQNDVTQNFNLIAPLTDSNAVTQTMEAAEYVLWQSKIVAAGQKLGSTIAGTL